MWLSNWQARLCITVNPDLLDSKHN
jgi:hypothetical protein